MNIEDAKALPAGVRVIWNGDPDDLGTLQVQGYTGAGIAWDDGKKTWFDYDSMEAVSLAPPDARPAPPKAPAQNDVIPLQINLSNGDLAMIYLSLMAYSQHYTEGGSPELAVRADALSLFIARMQKRGNPATLKEIRE